MILPRTLSLLAAPFFLTAVVGCESAPPSKDSKAAASPSGATALELKVDGSGYHPERISAPAGKPVKLTVTRTSDEGCGQQLVFPSLNIRRDLPLNRAVTIDFTMPASGTLDFTCGMDMMKGSIVAQ